MIVHLYDDHIGATNSKTAQELLNFSGDVAFVPIGDCTDANESDTEEVKIRAVFLSSMQGKWVLSAGETGKVDGIWVKLNPI